MNKKIPDFSINPFLLGAYVKPSYGGEQRIKKLPYTDAAFIYGAGVWINTILGILILIVLQILVPERISVYAVSILGSPPIYILYIYIGAFLVLLLPKLFCSYIIPLLGTSIGYLLVRTLVNNYKNALSGPVSIIMDMTPQMTSLINICKEIAIISIAIGLFNMLPLPPLDGGQIIRVLIKRLFKGKLVLAYEVFGIVCILGLLILALFGDILKLIHLII